MSKGVSNRATPARQARKPSSRTPGIPHRDAALVAVLREAVEALDADTALVYLFEEDREVLRLAAAGGSPPSVFIMPERIEVADPYPTAIACRSGRLVLDHPSAQQSDALQLPGTVPFPSSVAAAPLVHEGRCLGALTVVWASAPTVRPADGHRQRLGSMAEALSGTLSQMADDGVEMTAGPKPVIAPAFRPARAPVDGRTGAGEREWGLAEVPGSTAVTFMYHIHKLAAALNEAASLTDVMEVVKDRIMTPFGARAFMVTSLEYERVWVAGYKDCPQETVKRLHGSSMYMPGPFADVMRANAPLIYRNHAALSAAYPEPDQDVPGEHEERGGWIYVPIAAGSRPTAACALGFDGPVDLSADEQAVLMMMANLLGPTLARARLSQAEQSLAESVQLKLLPQGVQGPPGVATAARYVPGCASGMGGDWYDLISGDNAQIGLVIGDVEGHSIDSSVIMGQLRTAVRSYLMEGHRPAGALERTNRLLTQLDTDLLATCCIVAVDTADGTVELASAGHPAPVIRYPDGSVVAADAPAGLPLGVDLDARYTSIGMSLPPHTVLMLYTDGLTKSSSTELTAESLLASLGRTGATQPDRLLDLVLGARREEPVRRDDIALLIAEFEGAGSRPDTGRLSIRRHNLEGVKTARVFVRQQLQGWGLDKYVDDLEIMTSEVVTNALVHADSDVDLRVKAYEDCVRVEVRDTDPTPPVPEPIALSNEPGFESEHGRGLVIVEALASGWGNLPCGRGKTIWFEQAVAA
ncbi:SpoIIE family protein phosphatase [Streptomyces chiangmaiensis]|uniref:SpoIIE family protein phosphatase n=1 Tax=Streptomyces chiangmaiensis TaxID=766497 RepID=A0ABU7FKL5_9ACTN|nr:SpoIIE family protein phosphatase [Streptomyces chiangmaiensis]MED7824655.1 SpoIIE family protein phosphatase [Streptomyces chiangmaiensis]